MSSSYTLTMPRGFDRECTNVHKLQYHFIWCPKYRKSVFEGKVRDRLEELIEYKADELDLEILELAIRPGHVHLFIMGDPTLAPNKIIENWYRPFLLFSIQSHGSRVGAQQSSRPMRRPTSGPARTAGATPLTGRNFRCGSRCRRSPSTG